jgi:GT2 family glycosyltransferase
MILLATEFPEELGGLNENYFFGHEDVDICIEARGIVTGMCSSHLISD